MISLNKLKKSAAKAALKYILPGSIVGIGTGSTVSYFINFLSSIKTFFLGAVSSSSSSSKLLKKYGIREFDIEKVNNLSTYIDGADQIDNKMRMIKGGGAALTREKMLASISKKFICIVDETKKVKKLGGSCPIPLEVIPVAKFYIEKTLEKMGCIPKYRKGVITDNGNIIIDLYNLEIIDPLITEYLIGSLPGVVTIGIFASITSNILIMGTQKGVNIIKRD